MSFQNLTVFLTHADINSLAFKFFQRIGRIFTAALHINKEIIITVLALSLKYILRRAAVWICQTRCQHTAYFILRINFMRNFGSPCAGN